jgi:hypothetical protein
MSSSDPAVFRHCHAACWSRTRGEVAVSNSMILLIAVLVIILLVVLILQFV